MMEIILSLVLGIGLSAAVGFRIFVPLFVLSIASYFNVITLNENWVWIGSLSAIIILGTATLFESIAFLFPFIDTLLDSIALPLASIAGTIMVVATSADMSPIILWSLAIIAGGGTAAVIKGTTASTRLATNISTAGTANPILASIETGTSIFMSIVSIFLPLLAIFFVLLILFTIRKLSKYLTHKFKKKIKTLD